MRSGDKLRREKERNRMMTRHVGRPRPT
jgi:hypothetical protein